ncbi:MAG: hypothetical protein AAFP04_16035, partial [Myxococcota bacterium]
MIIDRLIDPKLRTHDRVQRYRVRGGGEQRLGHSVAQAILCRLRLNGGALARCIDQEGRADTHPCPTFRVYEVVTGFRLR